MKTIVIIGGGAAGLAAAVSAGEYIRNNDLDIEVALFEQDERVGRSILATGNGRCNVSNSRVGADAASAFYNGEFVARVLAGLRDRADGSGEDGGAPTRFGASEPTDPVLRFFSDRGLAFREESDGRLYPAANKATSVLDVLRAAARRAGVVERCGCRVAAVEPPRALSGRFTLRMAGGAFERADAVVIAVGGRALDSLSVEGARVLRTRPVLGPLKTDPTWTRELDNIRLRCKVSLFRSQRSTERRMIAPPAAGEVLFRKYGLSGIVVYDLSRFAWAGDTVELNMLGCDPSGALAYLLRRRGRLSRALRGGPITCDDMLRGLVLPQIGHVVLKRCGLAGESACSDDALGALSAMISAFPLEVQGMGDPAQCQVRRGGIDVASVSDIDLRMDGAEGLFCAGEALDVDGPCGGYNLHWAWASGLVAGRAAARFAEGEGA
ncbi:MAG: NAD(P)/FAD-dependent oxidoreductase [Berryella intestinalis]|uniref:NAD(P)/FAD-dependent oxidoreductase n=1 Tax=Berryella intestinalis TaxID=1531429 RepID=UPI002A7665FF|nr:NAD(P)/FAD-dependent oxidoreductase [Berryella intestinalis]MDY3129519.1 NAD(P)/FAD-dependent oxidoreductase [Berryella intestinalis]